MRILNDLYEEPRAESLPPAVTAAPSRKSQLLEVLVFLFLIGPSMVLSFFALKGGAVSFDLLAGATILRDLALVCLLAFFLWRNQEPVRRIGWTAQGVFREAVLGIVLFIPMLIAANAIETYLRGAGLSGTPKSLSNMLTPSGPWEFALAFILVVVVAIAEETIFRGYLMLRIGSLTGSSAAAVILSAAIFSVGHGYEGVAGVATVGFMGLVLALVYLWRRSLVAPMVMHFLQDFIAIFALPLLLHK